nr:hypothetical protein [bacterium]
MKSDRLILIDNPAFYNEVAEVMRIFYPQDAIAQAQAAEPGQYVLDCRETDQGWHFTAGHEGQEKSLAITRQGDALEHKRRIKRGYKLALYALLVSESGYHPPWGSLTGIRPTKLAHDMLQNGTDLPCVEQTLRGVYDVSPGKCSLVMDCLAHQEGIRRSPVEAAGEVDIYIGIPFCPTRCSYCSFAAVALGKKTRLLVPEYLKALEREMMLCRPLIQDRHVRAVYIGGGTPTALTPEQMDGLLGAARWVWGTQCEWTVEAGRPDT